MPPGDEMLRESVDEKLYELGVELEETGRNIRALASKEDNVVAFRLPPNEPRARLELTEDELACLYDLAVGKDVHPNAFVLGTVTRKVAELLAIETSSGGLFDRGGGAA